MGWKERRCISFSLAQTESLAFHGWQDKRCKPSPLRKHSLAYPLCASTLQLLPDFHVFPNENSYHLPQETNHEQIFSSEPEQKTVHVQKVTR